MFKFFKKKEEEIDVLLLDLKSGLDRVYYDLEKIKKIPRFTTSTCPITIAPDNREAFLLETPLAVKVKFDEATVRIIVKSGMDHEDIYKLFKQEVEKCLENFSGVAEVKVETLPCGANYIGQVYISGNLK